MIATDIVSDLPNLGAIIFEIAPDRVSNFGATAFLQEMETLHRLWEKTRPAPIASATVTARVPTTGIAGLTPEAWEQLIAIRMLPACHRPSVSGEQQLTASDERSFELYTRLAKSVRYGSIAELLKNSIRLLLIAIGEAALRDLLDGYTAIVPPTAFPSDEALNFRRFIDANGLSVPGLTEMLLFEAAAIEAAAESRTVRVMLARDLGPLLADIAAGRMPGPSSEGRALVLEVGAQRRAAISPHERISMVIPLDSLVSKLVHTRKLRDRGRFRKRARPSAFDLSALTVGLFASTTSPGCNTPTLRASKIFRHV
jgi:uncharacterized protein